MPVQSPNSLVMRTTDGRKQKSDNGDTNRAGICAIQRTARTWTCPSRNGNANGGIVVSAAAICPVGNGGVIPLRSSNCKRCSGRVYEAEKVVAASEVGKVVWECQNGKVDLEIAGLAQRLFSLLALRSFIGAGQILRPSRRNLLQQ